MSEPIDHLAAEAARYVAETRRLAEPSRGVVRGLRDRRGHSGDGAHATSPAHVGGASSAHP